MDDEQQGQSGTEAQTQQQGEEQEQQQDTQADQGSQQQSDNADADNKYRKAFEDQKKRAEKAEAELKKFKPAEQGQAQTVKVPDYAALEQRTIRAELTAHGVKDRTEQDFVINAAKRLGIDPAEALADDIITAKLEKMHEAKQTQDATPAPKKSGGPARNNGKLPDFSKMTNAEFDEWERKNRR